jgi:hypothetical protein
MKTEQRSKGIRKDTQDKAHGLLRLSARYVLWVLYNIMRAYLKVQYVQSTPALDVLDLQVS